MRDRASKTTFVDGEKLEDKNRQKDEVPYKKAKPVSSPNIAADKF